MYWQEDEDTTTVAEDAREIVDLAFQVRCRTLPLDHAHALSEALHGALPWLAEEALAGVHTIHGAPSGNGWYRPEETEDAVLHLSRRSRLNLRLPRGRLDAARALTGMSLEVAGHPLEVGEATVKPLNPMPELFSRYVLCDEGSSEDAFYAWMAEELGRLGIGVRKLLCGRDHHVRTPEGTRYARSVMVAELDKQESLRLQQQGVGAGRRMGCGLFIPHKGIAPVRSGKNDD